MGKARRQPVSRVVIISVCYTSGMDKILPFLSKLQTPVALACVAAIVLDSYLGLDLGHAIVTMLAAAAGALGVQRPTELAAKVSKALEEHKKAPEA